MRAISPHAEYRTWLVAPADKLLTDPRTGAAHLEVVDKGHEAVFTVQGLMDHEVEVAFGSFNFTGLPEGVNPLSRVSVFDTEAYVQRFPENQRDALLVQLDQRLIEHSERFPTECKVVPHPKAERPWPRYDEMKPEKILEFQEALGVKPERIRLYELENKGREEIISAMWNIEFPDDPYGGEDAVAEEATAIAPA